jgi:hypothetical protein
VYKRQVWLIGRTQTNGPADFENVHRLQDRLQVHTLGPQSASTLDASPNGSPWQARNAPTVPPVIQMRNMQTPEFFQHLMALMVGNPAKPEDAPMLKRLADAGLTPGQPVAMAWPQHACFALGRWLANFKVQQALRTKATDGTWTTPPLNLGNYGTDYNTRAAVAMVGLGANLPQDALYPNTQLDHQGQALSGEHRYRLHFAADQLPPVQAFWSITAYGADEFLIENPLKRYALGDRDPLKFNADGSLDIWIQAQEPHDMALRSNWLPVKDHAKFLLNARLYWPKPDALQGKWTMPVVMRID